MHKYSFIFSIKIIKMKNKILKLIVVLVIAVMAVFNLGLVSKSSDLSDVSLANVEALASDSSVSDPKALKGKSDATYGSLKLTKDSSGECTYKFISNWEDDGKCKWKTSSTFTQ
jgi:hypothetical protein